MLNERLQEIIRLAHKRGLERSANNIAHIIQVLQLKPDASVSDETYASVIAAFKNLHIQSLEIIDSPDDDYMIQDILKLALDENGGD